MRLRAQLMSNQPGWMRRTRGLALYGRTVQTSRMNCRLPLHLAEHPSSLQLEVSPDAAGGVDCPPFVTIVRKSGIKISAVVDAAGVRMICKDFPAHSHGLREFRVAHCLHGDDRKNGSSFFARLIGSCLSSYEGGFAMCFDRAMCSWAQYTRSPRSYDQLLDGVPVRASEMLTGVISAMHRMHELGFAHNDIKPDNVLITITNGIACCVLCDFGLAGRYDQLDSAHGTEGYRFLWRDTRLYAHQSDYWSTGILCCEVLCGYPFFSPWDFPALGQPGSTQSVLDDFVVYKFRTYRVAEAATPLRHVLVRDPASRANGLDPRLARDSLGQVVAYIARLEVARQLSVDAPPKLLSRLRMPAPLVSLSPAPADVAPFPVGGVPAPADVAPLPVGAVPAHLLKRSRSHKAHMRRDACKRRWRQAQREKEVAAGSAQDTASSLSSGPPDSTPSPAKTEFQTLDLREPPDWNDEPTQSYEPEDGAAPDNAPPYST